MEYMHTWVVLVNQLVYKISMFENRWTNPNQVKFCPPVQNNFYTCN